jgi:SAM-dependent methyltransferase
MEILARHRETWNKKKIIRVIYKDWYKQIISDLSLTNTGSTIELGGGSGNFKAFYPRAITSDIDFCQWLDICFDAHHIPFKKSSAANLVLIDVLHHLENPIQFLKEAAQTLGKGGRIIMLEPYPSLFSLPIYRNVHPEPFHFETDYFVENLKSSAKDPWDANQAMAYLLFFKQKNKFLEVMGKEFKILKRKRLSCILYPASGGFENRAMIPDALIPIFKFLEYLLIPFRRLLAFRCYIVLEKK